MWYEEEKRGAFKGFFRRKSVSRRRPILRVNARLRGGKQLWVRWACLALVAVIAIVATAAVGKAGIRRADDFLFASNREYILTNLIVEVQYGSPKLRDFAIEQLAIAQGTNLFDLDIRGIQQGLEKAADIKSAVVCRRLPSTLEIRLCGRVPIALLCNARDRRSYLGVDEEGMVLLVKSKSFAESLPVLTGYSAEKQSPGNRLRGRTRDALMLLEVCRSSPVGRAVKIAGIDIRDRGLDARLEEGTLAQLALRGDVTKSKDVRQDLENRLYALAGIIYRYRKAGVPLETVDLRHQNYASGFPTTPRLDRRN